MPVNKKNHEQQVKNYHFCVFFSVFFSYFGAPTGKGDFVFFFVILLYFRDSGVFCNLYQARRVASPGLFLPGVRGRFIRFISPGA